MTKMKRIESLKKREKICWDMAEVFLQNNMCLTLTSFDLGVHNYVMTAKEYIEEHFGVEE